MPVCVCVSMYVSVFGCVSMCASVSVSVYVCAHAKCTGRGQRTCGNQFSLSIFTWVPGIECRLSVLAAGIFICLTILPDLGWFIFRVAPLTVAHSYKSGTARLRRKYETNRFWTRRKILTSSHPRSQSECNISGPGHFRSAIDEEERIDFQPLLSESGQWALTTLMYLAVVLPGRIDGHVGFASGQISQSP